MKAPIKKSAKVYMSMRANDNESAIHGPCRHPWRPADELRVPASNCSPWTLRRPCSSGWAISDWLVRRKSPYVGRSLFGAFTLLLSGVVLIAGGHAQNGIVAALLLSGAVGALYLGQAVYYAVGADLGGPFTGAISGLVSMCGQIAGAVTASLTPFFASKYGWDYAFTIAAGVTFVCIIPWLIVNPNSRIHA